MGYKEAYFPGLYLVEEEYLVISNLCLSLNGNVLSFPNGTEKLELNPSK